MYSRFYQLSEMTTQQRKKKNLPLTHTENNSFLYLWDPCSQTLERLTPRPEQIPQLTNLPPATHPHLIEDSLSSQDIVSFLRVFFCVFQCPLGLSRSRQSHHQNHLALLYGLGRDCSAHALLNRHSVDEHKLFWWWKEGLLLLTKI